MNTLVLIVLCGIVCSCSDQWTAERRDGLKWEKDSRQAQEEKKEWTRP